MPGYAIVHATLRTPAPYRQGFEAIAAHLDQVGRPRHALCAVELRIPRPLSFAGFAEFNREYGRLLGDRGLLLDAYNPIARTNVAPAPSSLPGPSLYGFAYTVPDSNTSPTFVVAGAGDLRDQADLSPRAIVRSGEVSPDAMREKAACVLAVMQARLTGLGVGWHDVTTTDIYTAQPYHTLFEAVLLPTIGPAALHGVKWFYSRPPISGLAFEMDLRGVRAEIYLP